jgi:hypothetical protein
MLAAINLELSSDMLRFGQVQSLLIPRLHTVISSRDFVHHVPRTPVFWLENYIALYCVVYICIYLEDIHFC